MADDDLTIDDDNVSFSDEEPHSVNINIENGSPLNTQNFIGAHFNINSITAPGRLDELSHIANTLNLSYLIINESKLDDSVPSNSISIDNFHEPLRRDRNRNGGGCLVYISNNLTFKQQTEFQSKHFEHIWVDIRTKNKVYSINALYRPPNESQDAHNLFLQETENILSAMARHTTDNFILASDLNFGNIYCRFPHLNPKPLDDSAPELFESFGMTQLIDIPTRVTENTTSLIDLIFCQNIDNVISHGTLPKIADHDGTFVAFHNVLDKPKVRTRKVFDYKNMNENALIEHIKGIDFDAKVFSKPVLEQAEAMTDVLTSAFNTFVAVKSVTIRSNDQPWVNSYTRLLQRKKNRNYQFYKKVNGKYLAAVSNGTLSDQILTKLSAKREKAFQESKESSIESTNANRRSKEAFFNTVNSTMHNPSISAKKKFSILSKLMRNNKVSHVPPIVENGNIVTDSEVKSNIFNNFFASRASVDGAEDVAPNLPPKEDIFESLTTFNTSYIEVAKLCRDIKKSNSSHCGVPGKFIALIAAPIAFPLTHLYNNLFENGHFPEIFKIGHITALYKGKGLKSDKENYRGIHLLPTLSKIAESIIHARLLRHFLENNIISERQAAYIKGDSTTQQLLYIVNFIKTSWTKGNITQGCFLDVSAAFDKCWVNGLLAKLEQVKVEGDSLKLFQSYLTDRSICTVIDGCKSATLKTRAGVPQGSRLGPLLWILFIQDITEDLESECLLFADDTCIFASGIDPAFTAEILNRDLDKIGRWAAKWKVEFNGGKSKDLIFSPKKTFPDAPQLILNNEVVKRISHHKHLGVWLSSNLDWEKQTQEACLRANRKLFVLRSVHFLDRSTLNLLYKLTIRSVLEYGMIVFFHNLKQTQLRRFSQVQYRAAKLCTGALHFSSQVKLEEDLGWESLAKRAEFLGLTAFHKISSYETRPLVRKCLPERKVKVRNTRSKETFVNFKFTKFQNDNFMRSFFPHFTRLYNQFDDDMVNSNTYEFKMKLKLRYKPKRQKHYERGISKYSNSLHTQLRVGRSRLAAHGFAINLSDTDKCTVCGKIENTKHYLISCQRFAAERKTLFDGINSYFPKFSSLSDKRKVEIMMYGISLTNDEPDMRNISIVNQVQKYILNTKRFVSANTPLPLPLPNPPV